MRFWKGTKATTQEKIAGAIDLLEEAGLTVDQKGNVLHKGFIAGSLTPVGDFVYHPSNKYFAATETARIVIRVIGRSRSDRGWRPNS